VGSSLAENWSGKHLEGYLGGCGELEDCEVLRFFFFFFFFPGQVLCSDVVLTLPNALIAVLLI
jgi:hypothetical protein